MSCIYQNSLIRIEIEASEIPWLKIFTQADCKEMTDCNTETKQQIWQLLDLIEIEMRDYFKPEKVNIASFANYVPHVHWHIMARFKEDSFYPECMWGTKQREGNATFAAMDGFIARLLDKLEALNTGG